MAQHHNQFLKGFYCCYLLSGQVCVACTCACVSCVALHTAPWTCQHVTLPSRPTSAHPTTLPSRPTSAQKCLRQPVMATPSRCMSCNTTTALHPNIQLLQSTTGKIGCPKSQDNEGAHSHHTYPTIKMSI